MPLERKLRDNHSCSFLLLSVQAKVYCGHSCVWASLLRGQKVRLGILVSQKAFSPHVCWHASLNKCFQHPSQNVSLYRIRLWQTPLYSVTEAPPPPQSASCNVWLTRWGQRMCSSKVRWPIAALPAVTLTSNGSRFRCYCTPHGSPPTFKTLLLELHLPYKGTYFFIEDCIIYC